MERSDGRTPEQLRKIRIIKDYVGNALGSCLISFGQTRVLCTAVVEENVPPFLRNSGTGWVTAEYGMLPASTNTRLRRNASSGRTFEIQRLIGRSLRAVTDLAALGERTVYIDCDVIQADGGTRTASITGGFIALALALRQLRKKKILSAIPLKDSVAAVSVGMSEGEVLLDLNYAEDSKAETDMNIVMTGSGEFVEIQGTAEKKTFTKKQNDALLSMAHKGIRELTAIQNKTLGKLI